MKLFRGSTSVLHRPSVIGMLGRARRDILSARVFCCSTSVGLALIYLAVALPISLSFALVTLPYGVPDEPAQYFRAIQVGHLGLVSVREAGDSAGGLLPAGAIRSFGLDGLVHGPGHGQASIASIAPYLALPWGNVSAAAKFSNTASYAPVLYLPSALAIDLGRFAHLTVVETLRLARIASALVAVSLSALAIVIVDVGMPVMVVFLLQPMTMFLYGSASQDALIISLSAFLSAWLTRRATGQQASRHSWMVVGTLLGFLVAARLPYAPLAFLPIIVSWTNTQRKHAFVASGIALAIGLGWFLFGVLPLGIATKGGGGLLDGTQMRWLLAHPREGLQVLWNTARDSGRRLDEVVGVLGWLDTLLPHCVYVASETMMLVGFAAAVVGPVRRVWSRLAVLMTLVATTGAVFLALFLSWTQPGADKIDGVRGRYLIPIAIFGALLGSTGSKIIRAILGALTLLVMVFLNVDFALPAMASHLIN